MNKYQLKDWETWESKAIKHPPKLCPNCGKPLEATQEYWVDSHRSSYILNPFKGIGYDCYCKKCKWSGDIEPDSDLNIIEEVTLGKEKQRRYKQMKVLFACEFSGIGREAFHKKGHDAWSCDFLDSELPGNHIKDNVLYHLNEKWDLMIAHPPCTYLAVSGARWFKDRKFEQEVALMFVRLLMNADIPRICIENPISVISTKIRKPDQIIQPWQFGHGETKATCLWLKNLPKLQPTNIVEGREQRIWKETPSPERWKNRSRTYQGIAEAMAEQWCCTFNLEK